MKYLNIFILTVLLSFSASAQTTGYLGQKNLLQGHFSLFPAFLDFPGSNELKGKQNFLNTRYQLSYHRAISRKTSMGIFASYFTNEFEVNGGFYDQNSDNVYTPMYWTGSELPTANFLEIGIQFNFHSRANAPLGRYRGLKLSWVQHFSTLDTKDFNNGNLKEAYIYQLTGKAVRAAFVLGSTKVIKNKILFDYGLELGLYLDPFKYNKYIFTDKQYEDPSISTLPGYLNTINRTASGAGATNGFILLNFGIGYIW